MSNEITISISQDNIVDMDFTVSQDNPIDFKLEQDSTVKDMEITIDLGTGMQRVYHSDDFTGTGLEGSPLTLSTSFYDKLDANWSTKITNCLTKIPRDIKLELSSAGQLKLLAGSKLYVPNGVGVFDEITLQNDLSFTYNVNRTGFLCYSNGSLILTDALSNCVSGDTDSLAGQTYHTWYDTTNNQIKRYLSDGTTPGQTQLSLPLAVVRSTVADGFVEIKEIFDGLGYFGSRQFTLPGVKGLYPKGRNADGTLKNGIINCTSVNLSSQFNDTAEKILILQPNGHCAWYNVGSAYYDQNDNYLYNANNGDKLNSAILGTFTTTNGKISNFKPYHTFQAVDYNDFANTKFATNSTNTLRTLAERFENVINVKEFGAVGDGVTDDTSAISAAMAKANSGDVVFFPNGTYKVSTINITKRLNLFGGKIVSDSVAITVNTSEKGGSIQSMTLQAPIGISVDGYIRNLVVDNCIIMGATTCGIWVKQGNEFMFKNGLIYLPNDSETTGTGIKVDTWDCHFSNVVIQGYKTAIDATKGANIFDKIHAWFATDAIFPGSIFMKIQGQNQISNCYSDGYQYAFYLNNDWYSLNIANCLIGFVGHDKTSNTPYAFYFTSGKQDMTVNDTVKNKINCTGIEISGVDTELAYFSNVVGYCIDGYYERNGLLNQNVLNKPNGNSKITNCLTTIPQDIKLGLNNGTLTLKAGSKAYRPNGVGVFMPLTAAADITVTSTTNGTYMLCSWGLSSIYLVPIANCFSGTTQPSSFSGTGIWYDITNNVIKATYDGGLTWDGTLVFPMAIITVSSGAISSIDQVFNGLGYIGSTVFTLPGVKGLYPNGRNTDGTLKNGTIECTTVQISSVFNDTGEHCLLLHSNGRCQWYFTNQFYYDATNNVIRASYNDIKLNSIDAGTFTTTAGVISNFKPKTAFRAVDYNDTDFIAHQAMPSDRYVDLTLGASGASYTAPADGYIYLNKTSTGVGQNISIINDSNAMHSNNSATYSGDWVSAYLPVSKGQAVRITYTTGGSTNSFRFIYAQGAQ